MPVYDHYYPDDQNRINTPGSAGKLIINGPVLAVTISVTGAHAQMLQRLGLTVPQPVSGLALLDTGASLCAVDESVIQQLGIPPFGTMRVSTPSGTAQQLTYPAGLSFPGTPLPNIAFSDFAGAKLLASGIVALIG